MHKDITIMTSHQLELCLTKREVHECINILYTN